MHEGSKKTQRHEVTMYVTCPYGVTYYCCKSYPLLLQAQINGSKCTQTSVACQTTTALSLLKSFYATIRKRIINKATIVWIVQTGESEVMRRAQWSTVTIYQVFGGLCQCYGQGSWIMPKVEARGHCTAIQSVKLMQAPKQ